MSQLLSTKYAGTTQSLKCFGVIKNRKWHLRSHQLLKPFPSAWDVVPNWPHRIEGWASSSLNVTLHVWGSMVQCAHCGSPPKGPKAAQNGDDEGRQAWETRRQRQPRAGENGDHEGRQACGFAAHTCPCTKENGATHCLKCGILSALTRYFQQNYCTQYMIFRSSLWLGMSAQHCLSLREGHRHHLPPPAMQQNQLG